jgi:hypothetical protein
MYLIDPPSSADPTKRWQDFLLHMRGLDQSRPEVKFSVEQAQKELRARAKAKKPWWVQESSSPPQKPASGTTKDRH